MIRLEVWCWSSAELINWSIVALSVCFSLLISHRQDNKQGVRSNPAWLLNIRDYVNDFVSVLIVCYRKYLLNTKHDDDLCQDNYVLSFSLSHTDTQTHTHNKMTVKGLLPLEVDDDAHDISTSIGHFYTLARFYSNLLNYFRATKEKRREERSATTSEGRARMIRRNKESQ